MPLVEITHAARFDDAQLRLLAERLPHEVSLAVECPEEPYDGDLRPGDVDLRFRPRGPYDAGGLDLVIEVRSRWTASRAETRDDRCERLRRFLVDLVGTPSVGVFLTLPVAGWAQGE
ncbi:hypothetical protein GCM10009623_36330 [Nocardioides aestuarii]|uniref:Tautomerase family protein n=1 Tax=Nocardioides aestuarii TaxID=252231 RepID=A0ABW4TUT7_9ACTN